MTKFGPMDMATMEEICRKSRHMTFTQKAAEEMAISMIKVSISIIYTLHILYVLLPTYTFFINILRTIETLKVTT